jgi:hypothetical protein
MFGHKNRKEGKGRVEKGVEDGNRKKEVKSPSPAPNVAESLPKLGSIRFSFCCGLGLRNREEKERNDGHNGSSHIDPKDHMDGNDGKKEGSNRRGNDVHDPVKSLV